MSHLDQLRQHGWRGTQLRFDLDLDAMFRKLYPNRSVADLLCDALYKFLCET